LSPSKSASSLWIFAATAFPLQAIIMAVAMYLPQHYSRSLGLDLAVVGGAFAAIRLIDLPFDPLLGIAIDRTRTKWGTYRPWLALGAPITMTSVFMLFMAGPDVSILHIMFWLFMMYIGTSMMTLAHSAWAAVLSPTYNDRSRMFGAIGAMGVAGMTLVFAVPLVATDRSGGSLGIPEMGWFIIISIPTVVLAAVLLIREPIAPSPSTDRVSVRDYRELLTHPSMFRIVLAMFLFSLGTAWEGALFLFYFTDGRGFSVAEASMLLIVALAVGLAGAPIVAKISTKIGKHGAVVMTATAYTAAVASLAVIPTEAKFLSSVPVVITGFLYAGFHVLLRSMTADVTDEIRLEQSKERGALLYALITLAPKLSSAIAVGLAFNALALLGYDPSGDNQNSLGVTAGLTAAYILGPICFVTMGAVCMTGYKLGPARTEEIQRLLEERSKTQTA